MISSAAPTLAPATPLPPAEDTRLTQIREQLHRGYYDLPEVLDTAVARMAGCLKQKNA